MLLACISKLILSSYGSWLSTEQNEAPTCFLNMSHHGSPKQPGKRRSGAWGRGLQGLSCKESWGLNRRGPGQCEVFQWEQQSPGEGNCGARWCSATSEAIEGEGESRGPFCRTSSYRSNTHLRWFQIEQGCSSKRREGGRQFGIPTCLLQHFKATFTGNWD